MQITSKRLREHYKCYCVNTPDVHDQILGKYATFYNAGVYGWNYDVYIIDDIKGIAIISGYRCFNCKKLNTEKMKKLYKKFDILKQAAAKKRLLDKFLSTIESYAV